jgi:hypothetical protein
MECCAEGREAHPPGVPITGEESAETHMGGWNKRRTFRVVHAAGLT